MEHPQKYNSQKVIKILQINSPMSCIEPNHLPSPPANSAVFSPDVFVIIPVALLKHHGSMPVPVPVPTLPTLPVPNWPVKTDFRT